jgi:hypothetical protein
LASFGTPRAYSSGTTLQPPDDFVGGRFTGRDLLDHWNVGIRIGISDRLSVGRQEALRGQESAALIAVRERVIASQVLD